jgi:RNA polymerase sigma factor (sigma-70 family)
MPQGAGPPDERDAIERLRRGDIGGLETLVRRYQLQATRAAYLIVRDRQLAEDIVCDAFLRCTERIHQFHTDRSFGPWFLRAVVNDALKAANRRARQVSLSRSTIDGPSFAELLVGDIDFANGLLTVRPEISKSKELRTVDVHDAVMKELDRYLRKRHIRRPEQPLFLTDEGKPFSEDGFDKLFRRIRRESGVAHFHAHLARHTWATRYKGDILELKRQGGWKDWKQVERYRHGQRPARENLVNPLDLKRTVVNFNRASA